MSGNFNKNDLRVQKTQKLLYVAICTLLNRKNFKDITVNDLCNEILISRATFYTHFNDKYDLLKYMLNEIGKNIVKDISKYEELEKNVNNFTNVNKKLITNILKEANEEVLMLLKEVMSNIIEESLKEYSVDVTSTDYTILINFLIGGLINHLIWMVENNFPTDMKMMNYYLYNMVRAIIIRSATQK